MKDFNWDFTGVWNNSLLKKEARPTVARKNVWASELGKAPIDIWLRMKGTEPTNPPNERSMRKFEAGDIWEWIVKIILIRSGILQDSQKRLVYQYPGMIEVTGRLDFIAGGKPDYEKASKSLEELVLPESIKRAGKDIVEFLRGKYPDGLESKVLEIKSVSSFMFEAMDRSKKSSRNHRLQNFHYLKSLGMERGDVVYVCRDDCRMMSVPVWNPSATEDEYRKEIETISYYVQKDEQPPLAPLIVFDGDTGRFTKNWNVAYSGYLTMLYGFKNQAEYDDIYAPMATRFNRVLTRMKNKEKLTAKNLVIIEEMKKSGFDPDTIVANFIALSTDTEEVSTPAV